MTALIVQVREMTTLAGHGPDEWPVVGEPAEAESAAEDTAAALERGRQSR